MNKIAMLLVATVTLALTGVCAVSAQNPQKIQLENGRVAMVKDGRAMTMGPNQKPVAMPGGTYKTADGRMLVVGDNGKVKSLGPIHDGPKDGKKKPKTVSIRNEQLVLKDGTRAYIKDGRLWVVVNQHNGQKKADKGIYKTKDGRRIEVGGGGKIVEIRK